MATIEIEVDNGVLEEAEKALHSIGMDIQIAVNVFLRRVAIEKGLPMSMTVPASEQKTSVMKEQSDVGDDQMYSKRNNNAITKDMVDAVWQAFIKYHAGLGEISKLSDEVAANSGMNRGSAFIYLNILSNLIKGEPNTRNLKMKDLEYFMQKIKSEFSNSDYQRAILSLKKSIPYWRTKLPGTFADKVEAFCRQESET
jgi:addiction module RelB/DinJ family antitoxin